ncbi:MAG TPA: CusA/CzcA family heavy metal efflux RND transporter [Flavobacteriales bacterium]|nr:CusA/CzcA family heavy metal efflux RND transporter [Flavobacteriales bacterium]HMR26585.1 CusA/CzcA family heavy metal efflux RND transporter [Flavobacteriales bacterium]
MLDRIIAFSIQQKLIVGLLVLGLIATGAYQVTRLPIDAVPDITNNQVQVITVSPALGAGDIERLITFPIEQATRNVPGIIEQRSFSRFGLSVVTIVFDDATDVYWARQQVTERLTQLTIPEHLGKPELGPVTTGLGEIYQYVVKPRPGYEGRYSPMELRTIQDWIVRRQLIGTEGVADVSSFGGLLKQVEIAVDPERLGAMGITLADVFDAVARNNANTGGAYIEKGPQLLFIRTEGLLEDMDGIRAIQVKVLPDHTPVLLRDVAEVRLGTATRYGALVHDQEEATGAIVMMLKGANSSEVVRNVKERIAQIAKTLPEGVVIEPFLDRTKMVNNAIHTVETNLMEGALIVVLILVLFLANLRAGLVVASVIPLAMLFAVIMMNLFGVSGNLMSLGALDFGLIVDGAVIIVEAVLHHMHGGAHRGTGRLDQARMDEVVRSSASRMMNSAMFGQVIILIVYLPILSLQGIEGKMFKPMAQTVAFAVLGAAILSLTYVPMMSALFLSKRTDAPATRTDRMMERLGRGYRRWLDTAIAKPLRLVVGALVLLLLAGGILGSMGGEFIPELEEGDFAVETRLLTGSSLSASVDACKKGAGILKAQFPEVVKVVSKIGSGEIPTDPMPIEAADMMVILKPKKEWTSAESFDELAEKMGSALSAVPGVSFGFQFPVQMRFNELMTGARQDVVCKIFGEDLDTLARYGEKLGTLVNGVEGAKDLYVERVGGLPQIVVKHDRDALARYALDVEAVNDVVRTAFAGSVAGQVFEGERRFDLVVRAREQSRTELTDVQRLLVPTPMGKPVPLSLLAKVDVIDGPNQVQREDAKRRITVGFNVRGRDVQSIVTDLQGKVDAELKLPAGYFITYGGTFENLIEAKQRLSVVVPIALLLILLLLYFAFGSLKLSLLVFSAVPLSAIGGVFALWGRGMPFSISAGVGFIALFGVAVLNGIVLISEFEHLRKDGMKDVAARIRTGTANRLRPVLMTASVASLGFLPMALSNGSGAEVQRPLATVVIGGLITATVLTLFVLPALYMLVFRTRNKRTSGGGALAAATVVLLLFIPSWSHGQATEQVLTVEQAVDSALRNNLMLRGAALRTDAGERMIGEAWDLPRTAVTYEYGQLNTNANDDRIAIDQSLAFPSVYAQRRKMLKHTAAGLRWEQALRERELRVHVRRTYHEVRVLERMRTELTTADSIHRAAVAGEQQRFDRGAANALQRATARSQAMLIHARLQEVEAAWAQANARLQQLVNSSVPVRTVPGDLKLLPSAIPGDSAVARHPLVRAMREQERSAEARWRSERSSMLPGLTFGVSSMTLNASPSVPDGAVIYDRGDRFTTVKAGIGVPLFFGAQDARTKAARIDHERALNEVDALELEIRTQLRQLRERYTAQLGRVEALEQGGTVEAVQLRKAAEEAFSNGQIDRLEWSLLNGQAIQLTLEHLDALLALGRISIELESYDQQ